MNIRDPVHGQIEFSDLERRIIDLSVFQRLRQIKQVGMTYLVYPGANHTRFEHSIGTMHLASQMGKRLNLGADEISQLRLAALLHDVGHMPFSHDCEEILSPLIGTHEQIGLKKINCGELQDTLSQSYSCKKISEIAFGKGIGDIICSDVGADRLDYLLRDAHFTGVAYGVIDWGRILAKLLFKNGELQIERGGLEAAESVILARFSMFHAVYYHHAVRIARKMLHRSLQFAMQSKGFEPGEISDMGDNQLLLRLFEIPECRDYAERINERRLFKRACVLYWNKLGNGQKKYAGSGKFQSDLQNMHPDAIVDLPANFKSQAQIKISCAKKAQKLNELSSISSSLEAAAGERATMLVICPQNEAQKVQKSVHKLL